MLTFMFMTIFIVSTLIHIAEKPLTESQLEAEYNPSTSVNTLDSLPGSKVSVEGNLHEGMKEMSNMLEILSEYCNAVVEGKIKNPNEEVGKALLNVIRSVPILDGTAFKNYMTEHENELKILNKISDTLRKAVDVITNLVVN